MARQLLQVPTLSGEEMSRPQDLHTLQLTSEHSVRERKKFKGGEHMGSKRMKLEEDRSRLVGLLIVARAGVSVAPSDGPLFRPGQSALQWWAPWFKSAPEGFLLPHYKKKSRPTWFSGEVVAYAGHMSIIYAGRPYEGHCYDTY